jgi:hypothetical protein
MKKKETTKEIHTKIPPKEKEVAPIVSNEEIPINPDPHIDQDFPGYPHPPSKKNAIHPETKNDKLAAGTVNKKSKPSKSREKNPRSEQDGDGSANAFGQTELSEFPENKKQRKPKDPSY